MSSFPANLRLALGAIEEPVFRHVGAQLTGPLRFSTQHVCEGAKFHSPNPLVVYREPVVPPPAWSDYPEEAYAWLCGTCRANLAVYLTLLVQYEGELDWEVRREFGNRIRALGERGWELHRARTVEGKPRPT